MNWKIASAIIGYWRSGAKVELISEVTGLQMHIIQEVISEYKERLPGGW